MHSFFFLFLSSRAKNYIFDMLLEEYSFNLLLRLFFLSLLIPSNLIIFLYRLYTKKNISIPINVALSSPAA
jgi:hypothetical protein